MYQLATTWPKDLWGSFDENSIGVVAPYMDHVLVLRGLIKKKSSKLRDVSVETVFNVQGMFYKFTHSPISVVTVILMFMKLVSALIIIV